MNYDYMIYPKQFRAAKIPTEKNRCFFSCHLVNHLISSMER